MECLHAAASIHLFFPGSLLTHFFSSVKEDLKNQLQTQQKLQFRQYHSSADLSDSPKGHQNIDNRDSSAMTTHISSARPTEDSTSVCSSDHRAAHWLWKDLLG